MNCYDDVATMIIKEVIQGMIDDDMIIQEKVGNLALYWVFPSQSYLLVRQYSNYNCKKRRKLDSFQKDVEKGRQEKAELEEKLRIANESKPDTVLFDLYP